MRLRVFMILLVIVPALSHGVCAQDGKAEDSAQAAARLREKRAKTVVIDFSRVDVEAAGSRSSALPSALQPGGAAPVPQNETTSESKNRVVLDGDKMRFENNHPLWDLEKNQLNKTRRITVLNETLGRSVRQGGRAGDNVQLGRIQGAGDRYELTDSVLNPIFYAFRGAHPKICPYPLTKLKPTGVVLPIDDADCVEYARTMQELVITVWLDPAKDYSVRRFTKQRQNILVQQLDVAYRRDEKWGWLPHSWVIHDFGAEGNVAKTSRIEVLETRIGVPQSADQFDFQFAPDAYVYDSRNNKEYRVQADGTMREIARDNPALNTVVSQPGDSFLRRHQWLLSAVGAVGVSAGVVMMARRKRQGPAI